MKFRSLAIAILSTATIMLGGTLLAGCAPEVGSEKWCDAMKEKPKGDWSANEASDYTKHCVF